MNLRVARNELHEPPKVRLAILVFEAVGLLGLSYLLVGLFA